MQEGRPSPRGPRATALSGLQKQSVQSSRLQGRQSFCSSAVVRGKGSLCNRVLSAGQDRCHMYRLASSKQASLSMNTLHTSNMCLLDAESLKRCLRLARTQLGL